MNKTMLVGGILAVLAGVAGAREPGEARDRRVIEAVRRVPARSIDPSLPQQPLEDWLEERKADPAEPLVWEVDDCGEQSGTPADAGRDFPMCVSVSFRYTEVSTAYVVLMVGTFRKGLQGTPQLAWGSVQGPWGSEPVKRLADLLPMASGRPAR